ncbi:FMN-dependent NADH-azoreductase [Polycladidibacter hongkongensis]|uniref:FMN-dependent NADH-azoreductase n=1 Tax=Polycladidibacter hongkongensis TaxID=1647556 RepID=UPI00082C7F56|nr:NAD(P)H-dependent oxidoreductase [Pseudovibrio hongkongensis]
MSTVKKILNVQSSARKEGSFTRELSQKVIDRFGGAHVVERDVSAGLPLVDEMWMGAAHTPADARSDEQKTALALSDELINELRAADVIVVGAPFYNFSMPASLKTWIDQVARAGETFSYTEDGPKGLLEGKKAIIVAASGGVPVGSPIDFNVPYLKQVLAFIGITEVEVVAAVGVAMKPEEARSEAEAAIAALSLAA